MEPITTIANSVGKVGGEGPAAVVAKGSFRARCTAAFKTLAQPSAEWKKFIEGRVLQRRQSARSSGLARPFTTWDRLIVPMPAEDRLAFVTGGGRGFEIARARPVSNPVYGVFIIRNRGSVRHAVDFSAQI